MQDKITDIFRKIENKFAQQLGNYNKYVTFGAQGKTGNYDHLNMEIVITADYEAEGDKFAKNDDSIRRFMGLVGIAGTWNRSVIENPQTGQHEIVYKINLATEQRQFNLGGFAAAKWDAVTLNKYTINGIVGKISELVKEIDRDFKPAQSWAYAGKEVRVIEQGSGSFPKAAYSIAKPQEPTNIIPIRGLTEAERLARSERYLNEFAKGTEGDLFIAPVMEKKKVVGEVIEVFDEPLAAETLRVRAAQPKLPIKPFKDTQRQGVETSGKQGR